MGKEKVFCVNCDNEAEFDLYGEELCFECLIDRLKDTRYDEFEVKRLLT